MYELYLVISYSEFKLTHNGMHFRYNIGLLKHQEGDLKSAIGMYRKAIAIDDDRADVHNNLGVALKNQGDLVGAEAAYRKVMAMQPTHANCHINLANILGKEGRTDEARALYQKGKALANARKEKL